VAPLKARPNAILDVVERPHLRGVWHLTQLRITHDPRLWQVEASLQPAATREMREVNHAPIWVNGRTREGHFEYFSERKTLRKMCRDVVVEREGGAHN